MQVKEVINKEALGCLRRYLLPELWHWQKAPGLTSMLSDNSECCSFYFSLQTQASLILSTSLSLSGQQICKLGNRCNKKSRTRGKLCCLQTMILNLLCYPWSYSWLGCSWDQEWDQIRWVYVSVSVSWGRHCYRDYFSFFLPLFFFLPFPFLFLFPFLFPFLPSFPSTLILTIPTPEFASNRIKPRRTHNDQEPSAAA